MPQRLSDVPLTVAAILVFRASMSLQAAPAVWSYRSDAEHLSMEPLRATATDEDLIAFAERWAALMEREDYGADFAYTDHIREMGWTSDLMRQVIKSYGDAREDQRVTVAEVPSDISQRKKVDRWEANRFGEVGEIWYDLNIDVVASDLTATFRVVRVPQGLVIRLNDIHVM